MRIRIFLLGLLTAGLAAAQSSEEETQYQGPEILSRNTSDVGERGGALRSFRPYGDIGYVFDSGLTGVSVNSNGQPFNPPASQGLTAGFGVIGAKRWHFDQLSLEFRGQYTYFTPSYGFNGTTLYLGLSYTHEFSPRWILSVRENAGLTPYSYGYIAYVPLRNTDLSGVPTNSLFDNKTAFGQTGLDLVYRRTRRLSFSFGGDAYATSRQSSSLSGLIGGRARADVAYRLTRKQTLSASYSYAYYGYQKTFGNTNVNSVTFDYSVTLGRYWDLALDVGVGRSHSLTLISVPLDPAIAAIVGPGYTMVVSHPTNYFPLAEAKLSRRFERASVAFLYAQTTSPGNGVYLLSTAQVANVSYSYVGLKRIAFSALGGYSNLNSLTQQLGTYRNFNAGLGATYKLSRVVFATLRYDYRHYTAQNPDAASGQFLKNENRISLGFAFSPGDKPLPIW